MDISNKVVVVTGAASGIGLALSAHLISKGAKVAMIDLKEESLKAAQNKIDVSGTKTSIHVADISNKERVAQLPAEIEKTIGLADVIINNAGIIQPFVNFDSLDEAIIEKVVNVNFWGVVYMIRSFMPHLKSRPQAHIVNVSSMGGTFPFPGQTLYGATKAAVKLLTEGMYAELNGSNINVTLVIPGAVDTNIAANSGIEIKSRSDAKFKALPAVDAAKMIVEAIEKNKPRVLVGSDSKTLDKLYRLNPVWAVNYISNKMKKMMNLK